MYRTSRRYFPLSYSFKIALQSISGLRLLYIYIYIYNIYIYVRDNTLQYRSRISRNALGLSNVKKTFERI